MKNRLKDICFFGLIFLVIDQVLKIVLSSKLTLGNSYVIIKDFFSLNLVHNDGAAFSLLTGSRALLIAIGVLAFVGIIIYISKLEIINDSDILIYGLLLGGILGNLVDRIIYGYVIDYLSFTFGSYSFPVFNFADMCIVGSIILMLINTIKGDLWKS